jgi:DNA-binding FrmR family transcriptional regulator
MAHTVRDKQQLLRRLRRARGQLEAVEAALVAEEDCYTILQTLAACRGALNGLVAEVIEGHIRFHLVDPEAQPTAPTAQAAQELISIIRSYLK